MTFFVIIGALQMGFACGFLLSTESDGHRQPHWYLLGVYLAGLALMLIGVAA